MGIGDFARAVQNCTKISDFEIERAIEVQFSRKMTNFENALCLLSAGIGRQVRAGNGRLVAESRDPSARPAWREAPLAPFGFALGRQDGDAGRRITYGIGRPPHRRGYAGSTMAEWHGEAAGMQSGADRRSPKRPAGQAAGAAPLAKRRRLGRVMVPLCA